MNNFKAIFIKQMTSLIKVPSMIIQGLMFLLIAAAFVFFLWDDDDYECASCIPAYVCATCEADAINIPLPSGVALFAVIFIGLALVGSASAMVYEDKLTSNLRFMAMADVKPHQYLLGTVLSCIIVVAVLLVFYALLGRYFGADFVRFMGIGLFGGLVSILLGIVIALSKYPLFATPISLILGLAPTFSNASEALARVLQFTFIQQVNLAMAELDADLTQNFLIIAANGLVILAAFIFMHRKNKLNV